MNGHIRPIGHDRCWGCGEDAKNFHRSVCSASDDPLQAENARLREALADVIHLSTEQAVVHLAAEALDPGCKETLAALSHTETTKWDETDG